MSDPKVPNMICATIIIKFLYNEYIEETDILRLLRLNGISCSVVATKKVQHKHW